jgi:Arc/MetJ-type ribon-helix-helix transcriptional regulator
MGTITFRPDQEAEQALERLTADGRSASAAIREALLLAAKVQQAEALRQEALALAADPDDVAEARAVIEDLEPLRAW